MDHKIIRRLGLGKIRRSCTVENGRLCAFAFTSSGHIIALETNRRSTTGEITNWSIHSEEFLIKKLYKLRARERYGKIDILVARWDKHGGWRLAKPCPKCESMMKDYGIRKISYTNELGEYVNLA